MTKTAVDADAAAPLRTIFDCLNRVSISVPDPLPRAERCIATIVTSGFDRLLDDLLGSLRTYGNCRDTLTVVFAVDCDAVCRRVIERHGAFTIACTARARVNPTVKSALYTAARVIDAQQFVCLDADMLVLDDIRPLFGALEACPEGSVLACREANARRTITVGQAISEIYFGRAEDFARLLGGVNGEPSYPLVVNDGLFAAKRTALLRLDSAIGGWYTAADWVDERRDVYWRNQFVFNLALAHLQCGVELDASYNLNLNWHDVQLRRVHGRIEAAWCGRPVRVLHFNGCGRNKYSEWRGAFGRPWTSRIG